MKQITIQNTGFLRLPEVLKIFPVSKSTWWAGVKSGIYPKYRRQTLTRLEQHVFPAIGALPITEITIPDVVTVIETIANKNGTIETAKRMGQFVSQTYRYAYAYNSPEDRARQRCLH